MFSRRGFLKSLASASLVVVSACEGDEEESSRWGNVPAFTDDEVMRTEKFPLGVQAGGMEQTTTVVWSYAPYETSVRLIVWRKEAGPRKSVIDTIVDTEEGYLKVLLTSLNPETRYRYGWISSDLTWSDVGEFQTAFETDSLKPLLVGATACTSIGRAPFPSLAWLSKASLDVFCHLGDMSYNDGSSTQADYRAAWARTLANREYRQLLSSVGTYQTWDDHEVANDDELSSLPPGVIAAGIDAFFESTPTRRGDNGELWRSFRWGKSVEFFVLDCRFEREPDRQRYISEAQMSWLKDSLAASPCHFKVLLNSVPIAKLPPIWLLEADRWQGYSNQRDELLDWIVERSIRNVWFLSGDFHLGAVWRIETVGARRHIWEIVCGPGGSAPSRRFEIASSSESAFESFFVPEQTIYASGDWAATTLYFDPITDDVTIRFISSDTEEVTFEKTLSWLDVGD